MRLLTNDQIETISRQRTEIESRLSANAAGERLTLEQGELLAGIRQIITNKPFSWSGLFGDLESLVPGTASISRLEITNTYRRNGAPVTGFDMAVLSRNPQVVIEMIDRMNQSGVFRVDMRRQNSRERDGQILFETQLSGTFSPRPASAQEDPADESGESASEQR